MKVSTSYIRFLYWKQVSSKGDMGGPGLTVMPDVIAILLCYCFYHYCFCCGWWWYPGYKVSYVSLIICSNSLPHILLFLLHTFAVHEAFKNTYIDIEELPTL